MKLSKAKNCGLAEEHKICEGVSIEHRSLPRVRVELSLKLLIRSHAIEGKTVDLNENGITFMIKESVPSRKVSANIQLPEGMLNSYLQIKWCKKNSDDGSFMAGGKFINLDASDKLRVRQALALRELRTIIKTAKLEPFSKHKLMDFAELVRDYLYDLEKMTGALEKREITQSFAEKRLHKLTNAIMLAGDAFERSVNNKLAIKKLKKKFRELVSCWAYKSYVVKRSFDKPRGYPGDFRTIEFIYDNRLSSQGIGGCFDKYFLNNQYAIAVRNRKNKMKDILREYLANNSSPEVKILNLACGSCREVRELLDDSKIKYKGVGFDLLDQDSLALQFSEERLKDIKTEAQFNYIAENVMTLSKVRGKLREYDMIYTIGLADYLPDRVLGRLIADSFALLKSGGKLVIAHKDAITYRPLDPDWFCAWTFYPRSVEEVIALIKSSVPIRSAAIEVQKEKSNVVAFFIVEA